jgi:hypothetical protein
LAMVSFSSLNWLVILSQPKHAVLLLLTHAK